jgi:urocanate hydratase
MPEQPGETVPRSVGRAFDLLEIVVESGDANLTTAAAAANLTPTTALRHLRALEARGYVRRAPDGTFTAGPTVLRLGSVARAAGPYARLVAAAQPVLRGLTERTGESSYLAVADGDRAVYLATCESNRSIRHVGWVGKAVPLTGTAVGDALKGLADVAIRTGAVEPDITAVARRVDGEGTIVAALSVIGPSHRMDDAVVADATAALDEAAMRLSHDVGADREVAS